MAATPHARPSRALALIASIAFSFATPLLRRLTNYSACLGVLQMMPMPTAASPFCGAGPSVARAVPQITMAAAAAAQRKRILASKKVPRIV